jgi:hypothetical protein
MRCRVKRWRLWLGVAGVTIAGGIVGLVLLLPARRERSTWDAYEAIRDGMTEPEVEALLGGPAGDRSTNRPDFCIAMTAEEHEAFRSKSVTKEWVNDGALILVGLDQERRVARKFCTVSFSFSRRITLRIAANGKVHRYRACIPRCFASESLAPCLLISTTHDRTP